MLSKVRDLVLPAIEGTGPIEAWIIDDTGFPKKGRHSVGVARQYCGQLGKQDNCQVAVTLSLADRTASLPVAYRLYLPQEWVDDPARRQKAGVPEAITFQTKPEIALDRIIGARAWCTESFATTPTSTAPPSLSRCCSGSASGCHATRNACSARAHEIPALIGPISRSAGAAVRRCARAALGQHLHVGEHRHEVRVAAPARDDVQVDVVGDPAPAMRPRFQPRLKPCGAYTARSASTPARAEPVDLERLVVVERRRSRRRAGPARPAGAPTSTGTCSARRARARRGDDEQRPRSGAQKMQPSCSSPAAMYSRRHGAHSGFGIARASACSGRSRAARRASTTIVDDDDPERPRACRSRGSGRSCRRCR